MGTGTSLGSGYVKFLSGHNDVKVNGSHVVRQDSTTCPVNCNGAGVGGALGKVVTTQRGADTQAEKTAEETTPELQALLDAEADERPLWEKTKDFCSGAWSSTKRIAEASVDDPPDSGVGVLKGIGNLPTDLWNLGVMASKYSSAAGIPTITLRAQAMEKAALAAHQAGDLTKANELASQASKMMNAGYAGDLFQLTSDAQTGGSVLSMFIPGSVVVKGASRAGKAVRGAHALDSAVDAGAAGTKAQQGVHIAPRSTAWTELAKKIRAYIKDVEARTGRKIPENQRKLLEQDLRSNKYQRLDVEAAAAHRTDFNRVKNDLISEWEKIQIRNGQGIARMYSRKTAPLFDVLDNPTMHIT